MLGTFIAFLGTPTAVQEACGDSPSVVCRWIYDLTDNANLANFADWFVARPLKVIMIFVLAYFVVRVIRRAIRRMIDRHIEERQREARERQELEIGDGRFANFIERAAKKGEFLRIQTERSSQRSMALAAVLRSFTSIVIYGLAIMIALGEFGVSLGPLIAGAGIVGVALGFGAQSLVKDFLSGIFMLIEDQYGVGDIVDVGEASGVVEAVNLRTTRLRDVNGTVWFVPNGEIRRVGNKSQQWARAVIDVGVAYDTDLARATEVIKEVIDSVWNDHLENATVLEEPEIWGIENFGDSEITIRAVLKVEPGEQWATAREVRKRLKMAFDRAGIEIPFPQRTIWTKAIEGEVTPSRSEATEEPHFQSGGEPAEG
ncbi:MAG TPA: mechanosensitive ion channel family protein [Acidimicrobiia bacterium]|nr:mechanosensitive ion channel family protein [Acidimicrobiia bacterium]